MTTPPSYAENVLAKRSVAKYADSIIRWGGVFRTIFTVLGVIYLAGGGIFGLYYGQEMYGTPLRYFFLGLIFGGLGALVMFGYRLFFDYLLMRAHQSKL
jgi:hypothetical protein